MGELCIGGRLGLAAALAVGGRTSVVGLAPLLRSASGPRLALRRRVAEPVRGVILDVDGTLVDSNLAHAQAWAEVLGQAGYDVSVERLHRLIGMGSDKLLPAAAGVEKDSPEGKRLTERRKRLFLERYLPRLQPTRGARELTERLRSERLRIAVASSAEGDELEGLLAVCGASDLADTTPPSDEIEGSKPEPDVVQAALRKIGEPAGAVLMLGDTPYDVEAARRAGVGIIGLRCGGWNADDLRGALAVFDDPADLLSQLETFFSRSE